MIKEIPVLHLIKHHIVNVCSGYKEAGLLHILMYMTGDERHDNWTKLLTILNIRMAARLMRRLSIGLHVAFQVKFMHQLKEDEALCFIDDLQSMLPAELENKWGLKFEAFFDFGRQQNATFAMNFDIMKQVDVICGVQLSERIGGPSGYNLLQACTKTSLLFAFVNGASSYAAYMTQLLTEHAAAPPFYKSLKYFSLPCEQSAANQGLDTIQEEEHRKAKKLLRPGASGETICAHLKRINEAEDMLKSRQACFDGGKECEQTTDHSNWSITKTDVLYAKRAASIIIRRGALSTAFCKTPHNVYTKDPKPLTEAI